MSAQYVHARTRAEVAELADRVAEADVVAFDTEFLWEKTYWPKLCLLQVAVDGVEAVADPLAAGDLTDLWRAIADASLVLVHAGAHDLQIMHRALGRLPSRVFDTQVAGGFLGHGDSAGYGPLVEATLGRRVRGGEGYTDWSRRPLGNDQLEYAVEDIRHLHDLWTALTAALERRGRAAWAREETERRFTAVGDPIDPGRMWNRVKGSNRIKGHSLAVLREVAAWREEEAMRRDESRRRVVPDQVLVEIARRSPAGADQIARMRGLHGGQARRVAEPLAAAVRRAGRLSKSEWPRRPPPPPFAGDPVIEPIASVLHGVVRMRARALDIAPSLLGTRADLEELVRRRLAGERGVATAPWSRWRAEAIGEDLERLLAGDATIRIGLATDGPGLEIG